MGLLDPAGAREEGDRVSEFGDVGRGNSNHHRGGGLLHPFYWVMLQEPGCKDLDTDGIRDGEGECREEILLVGGHVAPWQAVYGEVNLVWGRSEGAVWVVSHGKGLIKLVSHCFIVWGVSSGGGVEVSAEHCDSSFGVNSGGKGIRIGAVGVQKDLGHNVRGGGGHADRVLIFEGEETAGEEATLCCRQW